MRAALVIARKDLRLRLRDRSAIVFAFLAPLALATIITLAFGGNESFRTDLAIADLDRSDLSAAFVDGVTKGLGTAADVKVFDAEKKAKDLTRNGEFNASIVIPKGFAEGVQTGKPVELSVFRNADSPISGAIARAIAEGFADELNAGRLSVATAIAARSAGGTPEAPSDLEQLIARSARERIPIALVDGKVGARAITSASYFGPSMAIFFLSFTVQFGIIGILNEQREGTLKRILASPTRPSSVILGKSLGAFVLGIISLAVMDLATTSLLGATWGPIAGVAVLGSATIFAFMGVAAIGVTVAKTQEGASGFVGIIMSLFALLGGNFIPLSQAPDLMRSLSLSTPNGWALRGFIDLTTGAGLESLITPVAALLAIGTLTSAIAILRGRRLLAS